MEGVSRVAAGALDSRGPLLWGDKPRVAAVCFMSALEAAVFASGQPSPFMPEGNALSASVPVLNSASMPDA